MQLLKCCALHSDNKRVELFCRQLGLYDTENSPELDIRDSDFILSVLRILAESGYFKFSDDENDGKNGEKNQKEELKNIPLVLSERVMLTTCMDIPLQSAISLSTTIFGGCTMEEPDEYLRKLHKIEYHGLSKGFKVVTVDELLSVSYAMYTI